MAGRSKSAPRKVKDEKHVCGECAHVVIVTRFHTLSIKGKPTMGECPFWKESRCVLLSQESCSRFKNKISAGEL